MPRCALSLISTLFLACFPFLIQSWTPGIPIISRKSSETLLASSKPNDQEASDATTTSVGEAPDDNEVSEVFNQFVDFLIQKQEEIIGQIEDAEKGKAKFSRDAWGIFQQQPDDDDDTTMMTSVVGSGGITRVIQGGNIVEKGACSLTLINQGTLTAERAATIRGRQDAAEIDLQVGDIYSAAALSMVLHTKSPWIPTFRSDVRIFLVRDQSTGQTLAWFGGGADLTPYYLTYDSDIRDFHGMYQTLCDSYYNIPNIDYETLKRNCDDYFYLPARQEHRGTGGIFFDDVPATTASLSFVQAVANAWMPSWLPIVERRRNLRYNDRQRQWQLLRRGRYLEFNLLYDRGVKFGLANAANPRVEAVMVSAPPLIAYEYNHEVVPGSPEDDLVQVLQFPKAWVESTTAKEQPESSSSSSS